jgi:hypothetical protein
LEDLVDIAAGTAIHRFTLYDHAGAEHDYLVQEHPAIEGMEVLYELLGLGAPSLLGLASAALRSQDLVGAFLGLSRAGDEDSGADGTEGVVDDGGGSASGSAAPSLPVTRGETDDFSKMLSKLDLSTVGQELSRALLTGRAPKLTRRLLQHVHRDGKPLRDDGHFGRAYQANYYELMQLVWKVCGINRFFPQPSTWGSSEDASQSGTTAAHVG